MFCVTRCPSSQLLRDPGGGPASQPAASIHSREFQAHSYFMDHSPTLPPTHILNPMAPLRATPLSASWGVVYGCWIAVLCPRPRAGAGKGAVELRVFMVLTLGAALVAAVGLLGEDERPRYQQVCTF